MRAAPSDLPLTFDDVSLTAGATTILDRVSLTIGPGAPTLILGPNGSGKTSLLRLCMGKINDEELSWLGERAEELGRVVHQVCTDKIAELEKAASAK